MKYTELSKPNENNYHNWSWREEFGRNCTGCGEMHVLRTQPDNDPEYYTEVYIPCKCGEAVKFDLPVN